MFGSDDLNVTGRGYVSRYAPNRADLPNRTRGRMVGWRSMEVTGSPVSPRSIPAALFADRVKRPEVYNQGGGPVFGLSGSNVVPETLELSDVGSSLWDQASDAVKSLVEKSGGYQGMITNFLNDEEKKNQEEAEKLKRSVEDAKKADTSTQEKIASDIERKSRGPSGQSSGPVTTPKEPGFFSTPTGIAVTVGGGVIVLLGAYLLLKK